MRYYHGSNAIFKEFDKARIGQNFTYSERSGFFFIKKKLRAEGYAGRLQDDGTVDGFVFEVELKYENPVEESTNSDYYTPADYYDINSDNLLRAAFLEKKDAIYLKGTQDDDVVIVFEPEQVEIKKVYHRDKVVYDSENPELTEYPDIMGPDVDPGINKDVVSFHYSSDLDPEKNKFSSSEFGNYYNTDIKAHLQKEGVYHDNETGVHFGVGESFTTITKQLITEERNGILYCREGCGVIHDLDQGITMIVDLTGSGDDMATLMQRPMRATCHAKKNFAPDDSQYKRRILSETIGPEMFIEQQQKAIPDWEEEIVEFDITKPDAQAKESEAPNKPAQDKMDADIAKYKI